MVSGSVRAPRCRSIIHRQPVRLTSVQDREPNRLFYDNYLYHGAMHPWPFSNVHVNSSWTRRKHTNTLITY